MLNKYDPRWVIFIYKSNSFCLGRGGDSGCVSNYSYNFFRKMTCHSVLGLDLADVEDVRELGEKPPPHAGDPQLDHPFVGDFLPHVGGVELLPQHRVLVGHK